MQYSAEFLILLTEDFAEIVLFSTIESSELGIFLVLLGLKHIPAKHLF